MDIEEAKRILGITDEDDGRTAKIKFRRLIGRYHPDAAGTDSKEHQELAQRINAAYSLLKSEEFFLTKAVAEVVWREIVNESVFTARNIYAPYHYWSCICEADRDVGRALMRSMTSNGAAYPWDIDSEGLYQRVTNGKYMWDPNEEEFPLFLRSIYHAARDLLDAVETECNVTGNTDALRISSQERLFHCLAMQFVEPADCLPKIAEPDMVDKENRKIYRFRAYVGEKQNLDIMRRIASLRAAESVYPAAIRNGRLMIVDQSGGSLGHLSFAEDELYYCLFPFMSAHVAQVRLTVKKVQRNKGNYLRHAKAEIEFLIRLNQEADNYRNPDMNERIERILSDYRNQLRGTAYSGRL
ncbi:MAG: DnaJ domain-containing protein [Lachnospiraceae bacterium]|nr:DnaJ domain-containing protein [Lachnospiraceae bacterium]